MADPFFPICQIGKLTLFRHAGGAFAAAVPPAAGGPTWRIADVLMPPRCCSWRQPSDPSGQRLSL